MKRSYNFNAGPSALPLEVLEKAQRFMTNFDNTGMSVMELSHRSKAYSTIHNEAIYGIKELLHVPDNYDVLLLQGGASLQFTMIPLNFLQQGQSGNYVVTGVWSEKARKEAQKLGETSTISSGKDNNYSIIPSTSTMTPTKNAAYVHITSNNTIYGTQFQEYPVTRDVPLIADMSSDILSKELDLGKFSLIYAGAQKNLGPAGVTVVIIKRELLRSIQRSIPTYLDYRTHVNYDSLYNTPPTFSIYILSLVLEWVRNQGGLKALENRNNYKAEILYNCIDQSNEFYVTHAIKESRSNMNVVFSLPSEELTEKFIHLSEEAGFVGLKGYRTVGGIRASIYNSVPVDYCERLVTFMQDFKRNN